eukprot:5300098-Pyramimonas_sp.AAC.1
MHVLRVAPHPVRPSMGLRWGHLQRLGPQLRLLQPLDLVVEVAHQLLIAVLLGRRRSLLQQASDGRALAALAPTGVALLQDARGEGPAGPGVICITVAGRVIEA